MWNVKLPVLREVEGGMRNVELLELEEAQGEAERVRG
jgi:hypothetical protein